MNKRQIIQSIAEEVRGRFEGESSGHDWWHIEQVKAGSYEKTEHPCQTPEEVMRRILLTTPAPLVVDPFMGSGTTLVAARELGIRAIGIDLSAEYCRIAERRIGVVGKSWARQSASANP